MLKNSLKILKHKQKDTNSPSSRKKSLSTKRQKSKDPLLKPSENTEPRKQALKKPPLFKKPSIDLQKSSILKTPKHSKVKLFAQTLLQGHNPSDTEKSCKVFDKNRARSNLEHSLKTKLDLSQKILTVKNTSPNRVDHIIKVSLRKGRRDRILKEKQIKQKRLEDEIKKLENNYQNNLIRKINKQKCKVRKLSPDGNYCGAKGYRKDMFKAFQGVMKGTSRSVSTKRNEGPKKQKISGIEKYNPIPVQETYRRKSLIDQKYDENLHPSKTEKIKILRNISLFENSEIPKIDTLDQIPPKPSNEIISKEPIKTVNKKISSNKLQKFKENRAAKIIQKAFCVYMERKREISKSEQKNNKLQEIVQEQLGWREAQLVSLEYLKVKELEDLESLLQLFGENKQLKDFLFDVVNKRFNEFTKVFKESLENTEQAIIEDLDTLEVIDFSNKIKDKKDFVGKIIEGVNLNASLSKNEVENLLKETKDEVIKHTLTSTSCQTSSSAIKQVKKVEEASIFDREFMETKGSIESKSKKNSNFEAPNTSPNFFKRKNELQILNEVQDLSLEQFSVNDILSLDQNVASPIYRYNFEENPSDSVPRHPNCTSPIPDRPSAPLLFLDTDENISLESLLNISTPLNKKSPQNLPLLNLGKLPGFSSNIPVSSDPRIETSPVFIKSFISGVFSTIDKSILKQEISKGITKDPLKELEKIREIDLGSYIEKNERPMILNIKKLVENFLDDMEEVQTTQRIVNKADKIHKIMLLSVTDEVLQKFRPYGIRGVPGLWSERTRNLTEFNVDIEEIVKKALEEIEEYCLFEIGKIATDEMILTNGRVDEDLLADIREDALGNAISKDIVDSEWQWTDYEFEETQVKIDLADMVLDDLTEEMLKLEF